MTTFRIPDCGKGVIKDLLPSELAVGVWSDAKNFRFRNGFAELWGGVSNVANMVASYASGPVLFTGAHASATVRYAMSATTTAAGAYGTSYTNLTRYTDGAAIASITRVGTTATLTTSTNHGSRTADVVSVYAAYPTEYNVTGAIAVTGPTTFTYTMASDPGASASTLGAYSYNVTSNFNGAVTARWTGCSFNGIYLLNNKTDGLYYWNGDTSIRFRKMPVCPYIADAVNSFKEYIVSVGITEGGVKYPHRVAWSNSAESGTIPTAFTASDTNDAGFVDKAETPGHMVYCLPLGDTNIIYKQDARYAMRYIGGNDVFSFTRLPGNDGLLAVNCVADTPVGHVFLTNDLDVMVHSGGAAKSIAVGRIKEWLASSMKSFLDCQKSAFLCANPDKSEVLVCLPTAGINTVYCTKAAVWNWESDAWSIFDFTLQSPFVQLTHASAGLFEPGLYTFGVPQKQILFVSAVYPGLTNYGGIHDEAGTFFSIGAVEGLLERVGMDFGDRDTYKAIDRSRWNIDSSAGKNFYVYHGSSVTADGTTTYTSSTGATVGTTDYVNARAKNGRFGAIKMTCGGSVNGVNPFKLRTIDLDVTGGGKR
jgi:hypothetical protein